MAGEYQRTVKRYTLNADEAPNEGVYSVVAALEGRSPLDLVPLAEAIDPDALDALLADDAGTNRVSFSYCGYEVTATSDEIRVAEIE